jgi:hypothetical protein
VHKELWTFVFKEAISFDGYIWLLLAPSFWDLTEEEKMSSCIMQDTGIALRQILGE